MSAADLEFSPQPRRTRFESWAPWGLPVMICLFLAATALGLGDMGELSRFERGLAGAGIVVVIACSLALRSNIARKRVRVQGNQLHLVRVLGRTRTVNMDEVAVIVVFELSGEGAMVRVLHLLPAQGRPLARLRSDFWPEDMPEQLADRFGVPVERLGLVTGRSLRRRFPANYSWFW